MPRTFISQDPFLAISHPDLKAAAGNPQFLLTFAPKGDEGHYETSNDALADALSGLVAGGLKGVIERGLTPPALLPITAEDLAAKLAELTKPAEGEEPAQHPTIAQLGEAFDAPVDETFLATLSAITQASPEVAEAFKAAGIVIEPPEVKPNVQSAPRRGQRG